MIIGIGKLAKAIIHVHPTEENIHVFSQTKEKVLKVMQMDHRVQWIEPEAFYTEKEVWLLLPPDAIPTFIEKYIHCFHPEATFYYCATKGLSEDMGAFIQPKQSVVPVKFITQADQLMKDKKGMAAIPAAKRHYLKKLKADFGNSMEVVIGEEKDILLLNKTTTEMAIGLVLDLQEEMEKNCVPKKLVDHAAMQIVPGVIQSFLNHSLGGFGKQVIEERSKKNESR